MRRNSIQVGDSFLTLTSKLLIVTRSEFIIMICTTCGYRKSSYVVETKLDRDKWEWLAAKLNQLPRCTCLGVQSGTDSNR